MKTLSPLEYYFVSITKIIIILNTLNFNLSVVRLVCEIIFVNDCNLKFPSIAHEIIEMSFKRILHTKMRIFCKNTKSTITEI